MLHIYITGCWNCSSLLLLYIFTFVCLEYLHVASLRAGVHQPLLAVQHLESSPSLPDILRMNYADGLPYVVIEEFLQGVRECSGLQRQGASDRYIVPNPCHT